MKNSIIETIDQYRQHIIDIGETILKNPELGYKEFKTAALVEKEFESLGLEYISELAVTGVKSTLKIDDTPVNICIIGEMDAVKCYGHPFANPETGAAHACGHNAQVATMLGAAYGLLKSGALKDLCGQITFFAVPAEEFAELDYRMSLRKEGKIEFFGGKQELIRIGAFDDVNIAIMVHALANSPEPYLHMGSTSLGFTAKHITFTGKASHGSRPWEGTNALNAAMMALMGINANRETFRDEDKVRIHPIITNGGELVNVIPAKTEIETYVRGGNPGAIKDACQKVDNAVKAGALAVGADCEIEDIQGYMPLMQDKTLGDIFEENAKDILGEEYICHGIDMTGSTDMGDLSLKIPSIQPILGGITGTAHGEDYTITNKESIYITPAKLMACTVYDLLKNNAEKALKIIKDFKPAE